MVSLSLKINVMPGITRNIDITLEELLKSFNNSWDLDDRIELVMGIDVSQSSNEEGVHALAKIFNNLKVDNLTTSQLLILISTVNNLKDKLETKKAKIVKELKEVGE